MTHSISNATRAAFEEFIRLRTGLVWTASRRVHLTALIEKVMRKAGIADSALFLSRIHSDVRLLNELADELTVRETYFFRDRLHLDFLLRQAMPALMQRKVPGQAVRIWSAGCASGEEPYTLAILLEEAGLSNRAKVLATDISLSALETARLGTYSEWSLRSTDERARNRYFRHSGRRFILNSEVRERVLFRQHNLAASNLPDEIVQWGGVDVVILRNVLMYFDTETIRRVVAVIYNVLPEGGWLITGPSDPLFDGFAPFTTVVTPEGVFYRRCADASHATVGLAQIPLERSVPASLEIPLFGELPAETLPPAISKKAVLPNEARQATKDNGDGQLPDVRAAYVRGDYALTIALTSPQNGSASENLLRINAIANQLGIAAAETACAETLRYHKLSVELRHLHAMLLLELGRHEDAIRALRHVLLIDRSLAAAHFALGNVLRSTGEFDKARRAYSNARDLCLKRPDSEEVALTDGGQAGHLLAAACAQLAWLDERIVNDVEFA